MRRYVDEVLAILPFEPAAFARLGGPHCTYVGHPLAEQVDPLRPKPAEAERRLSDPPLLLVLPGSRASEVRRLTTIFGETIAQLAARTGAIEIILPTLPHVADLVRRATAHWPVRPRIVLDPAEKQAAFRSARAALAASGTVTLELALAQVPTVAAYRIPLWEGLIFRMMAHIDTVILANLVLGEKIVPEFLQSECTADRLAAALVPLLRDTPERRHQTEAFVRLDRIMDLAGEPPSARAARAVLALIDRKTALPSPAGSC
jgi:lipid-A-disaccharide synthase